MLSLTRGQGAGYHPRVEFRRFIEWTSIEKIMGQQIGAGISHGVVSPAFLVRGVLPEDLRRGDSGLPAMRDSPPPRTSTRRCEQSGGVEGLRVWRGAEPLGDAALR